MPVELFHRSCISFRSRVDVTTQINSDVELGFTAETNDPSRTMMEGHFSLLCPPPKQILIALCKIHFLKRTELERKIHRASSSDADQILKTAAYTQIEKPSLHAKLALNMISILTCDVELIMSRNRPRCCVSELPT
ncbi:hypothetical protein CEXT_442971 [Caerostris extrusa]|uniref:Uncharacterized protein n=1 Tax=Caerostris extrusa TaxID=172846 RepID=A0AAV4NNW6_CAEEX|nr:hypothetical protein CEXT_442971 [Caerostris extrusa]